MTLEIVPTRAAAGAEIKGVDLRMLIGDDLLRTLDRALGEYGVIYFRDQDLTPEHQTTKRLRTGSL